MKISEMIKNLEEIKQERGDLECWYASDEEGNEFGRIYFDSTVMFRLVGDDEKELRGLEELDDVISEHEDDYENGAEDEDFEPLKIEYVVCVN